MIDNRLYEGIKTAQRRTVINFKSQEYNYIGQRAAKVKSFANDELYNSDSDSFAWLEYNGYFKLFIISIREGKNSSKNF